MKQRVLACVLSLVMVGGMITGCGDSKKEDTTATKTESEEKTEKSDKKDDSEDSEDNMTEDLSEYEEIEWPDTDVAKMIPKPKSMIGKYYYESDEGIIVDIANTSNDAYKDYVEKCKDMGYTEDHVNMDGMYSGKNSDGYGVVVSIDDTEHVMSITFAKDDVQEDTSEQ